MKAWLFVLAATVTPVQAVDHYTIDPASSVPVFEVTHLGYTTQRGRFNRVAGRLVLDLAAHSGSVEFTIDSASLDMGSAAWTAHLADESLFNTLRFPSITFKSSRLEFEGERVIGADGGLTMIGVTKPVHLVVQRFKCGGHPQTRQQVCGGDVTASIRRSDFGLIKYLDAVSDEVRISVPVLAVMD